MVGECHFQAFWVGSKPSRSIFLRFLEPKNKRKISGKYRKKSEKRNFGGDILSISTDNRYFGRNIANFVPCLQSTRSYHSFSLNTPKGYILNTCMVYISDTSHNKAHHIIRHDTSHTFNYQSHLYETGLKSGHNSSLLYMHTGYHKMFQNKLGRMCNMRN